LSALTKCDIRPIKRRLKSNIKRGTKGQHFHS